MSSTYHRLVLSLTLAASLTAPPLLADSTTPAYGIRDKTPRVTAFVHARIVVSPDLSYDDATLVLRDGRVEALGPNVNAPDDAVVIDATGKTLYPGFVEPYTEYGLTGVGKVNEQEDRDGPVYEGRRYGASAWNEAIHAERNWVDHFTPDAEGAKALMERGVTTVYSTKMDGIFRGRGFVTLLDDSLANDAILRAQALHSAAFDKGSSQQPYPTSLMGSIALVRQTLLDAKWYGDTQRLGRSEETNTALAALSANREAIVFDTEDELTLLRAARISEEMDTPFLYIGSNEEYLHLDPIRTADPTLILPLIYPKKPEVGSYEEALDVSLAELRHWERAPSNPAILEQAGLRFALTGYRSDEDFLGNLRLAVKRGLSPQTALAALTTVPADLLGLSDQVGTLEVGRLANLVVTSGDILDDDEKILAVWIAGRPALENEPLDATELTGLYRFDLDGVDYRLHLTRAADKLEGTLARGDDDKVVLSSVTDAGSSIAFRSPWGTVEDGGVSRFSVARIGEALRGTATLPDGRTLPLELEAVAEAANEAEATEDADNLAANDYLGIDDDEEEAPLVSRMTSPPLAFGFEELPRSETVLVRNATIWTLDANGTVIGDLLVRDGKIAAVGIDLDAPSGARVIDASGKHVTPGIIDEHSHVGISGGVNEGSHSVTAEVRIGDVVNPDHVGIYRALGGGVTTIQQLHGSANPIGGQAQIIKLRWGQSAEAMKFDGAPPSIKFALGENVKQSNWGSDYTIRYPQSRMGVETIMRDGFVAAREYAAAQRAYRDLPASERQKTVAPRRDLQLEALGEILDSTRFIHCHSYVQSEILMLMRLADELGFKVQTFTHILEGYKAAAEMAEHGAGGSTFSDWWAYKFEVYDAIPQNMCIMNDAGVVTSVNSDSAEHMRRLNQEAAKAVMYCGMNETEALAMATLNPAKQLRIDDRVGSLTPGKDADFVIWNGHPLSIYSTPEQTWIDGILYFSRTRDTELRARDAGEREALIQKLLAEEAPKAKDESGDATEDSEMAKADGDPVPEATKEWQCDTMEDIWND